ncbi:AAA family ATPase [Picosynechococcus sp. PCC 73109]|uniref:AAA family ATPase n=1 Tax=Picosynechococcus sp. PCC 73109 TaxID=374982 RepID=UPI0007458B16|nr:AAA family ATPase [Picosynechococcus sp. PCC 73109]AMA08338.1 kinase [Picosynechococcus sp. PCC 73109]
MFSSAQPPSHFLIGAPGSGKSTFAQWLRQTMPQACLISTDGIRAQLYEDPGIQGDWPTIEAIVLWRLHQAIAQGKPVIYDATNCHQPWRLDFLEKCPPMDWLAWYLACPLEICLARNQRRSRQVPPEIIEKMIHDLEAAPPQAQEGFLEIITLPDLQPETLKALKKQQLQYLDG